MGRTKKQFQTRDLQLPAPGLAITLDIKRDREHGVTRSSQRAARSYKDNRIGCGAGVGVVLVACVVLLVPLVIVVYVVLVADV